MTRPMNGTTSGWRCTGCERAADDRIYKEYRGYCPWCDADMPLTRVVIANAEDAHSVNEFGNTWISDEYSGSRYLIIPAPETVVTR